MGQRTYRGDGPQYRAHRLATASMGIAPSFRFDFGEIAVEDVDVVDLSPGGLCMVLSDTIGLEPGSVLDGCELEQAGVLLWSGPAIVVHRDRAFGRRVGIEFLEGSLDVEGLELRDQLFEVDLSVELLRRGRESLELSCEWRAALATLRQLFALVEACVETYVERSRGAGLCSRLELASTQLFAHLWPHYRSQLEVLDRYSLGLAEEAIPLAREHARRELLPYLQSLPGVTEALAGERRLFDVLRRVGAQGCSGYPGFLAYLFGHDSLGSMLNQREELVTRVLSELLSEERSRPLRILCLNAGPMPELRDCLLALAPLRSRVEITILDTQSWPLKVAEGMLRKVLAGRRDRPRISFRLFHVSESQLSELRGSAGDTTLCSVLRSVDFVWGLCAFDQLPRASVMGCVEAMLDRLPAGARMIVGALERAADSAWLWDYVLNAGVHYRNRCDLLELTQGRRERIAKEAILEDGCGRVLGLDVRLNSQVQSPKKRLGESRPPALSQ